MLLAADIGNTNLTFGLFAGRRLVRTWRARTESGARAVEAGIFRGLKRKDRVGAVVYGSVVPKLNRPFQAACRSRLGLKPLAVSHRSALGVRLKVDHPSQVGADRILNALAAYRRTRSAAVVIDFGTATTFDCVSSKGEYLGGAILPGPRLSAKALGLYAAKLPEVAVRPTRRVIGKNTVECLQAGVYFGYVGAIEYLLEKTLREMRRYKGRKAVRLLATGGLSGLFKGRLRRKITYLPNLTLEGLLLAYETIC